MRDRYKRLAVEFLKHRIIENKQSIRSIGYMNMSLVGELVERNKQIDRLIQNIYKEGLATSV